MERPRDMDIQKFEVFLKIIETGSLTRAADMMDYTQSAVSHAISTLESEFNVRLLVRDRSGVKLTSDGRALLPYIRSVINAYREFQNKTAAINNLDYGSIRIGTFTSIAVHWLPHILNGFREQHPAISFEIKQGNYAQICQWILDGTVDCGFTIAPQIRRIHHILLAEDRLFAIYPPGHPLDSRSKIYPEDMSQYPFILVDEGDDAMIRMFFEQQGIDLNIQYRVVDDYAVVSMVEGNLGISVCPELFFNRLPFRVNHKPLETDFRRKLCISYKENYQQSPPVVRFMDYVQQWAASGKVLRDQKHVRRAKTF